ncbi:MAG: electron transport complex subunit RsxE [Candidatus Dactylopiibacterium carminicum]|uniref:Ion-translocating oxidoreductase complex subunit E n=1 Tax=Candidatus Dactylopiibacterium carminicum TaxID=857335 RepID=A0A272EQW9_9RHOO|nr:electron transport complex subunit E [Candidatus Dactylopiibacterium carminicum]KAF7598688.1 electron transport complex subunit RsxE [Candidatus Dactylopiibacterium carminicum]PAS92505.1 MAG: electron transport complex subunit RsxE [Candidatus Dactylopiibacterium carminicum]PAS98555.1 MAG: electron transport complex subunit RsxE [Candidatus Dactylopiibacterium carminicum]
MSTQQEGRYLRIVKDGLWDNNGVLAMLLGMCPSMAMTTSATNALGMGLATAVVMAASSLLVAVFRHWITQEIRIPVFILIVAAMVTLVDITMNAWMHELYKVLGLFIPLIVSNCLPLARLEAFAAKERPYPALLDGAFMGLGFTLALVMIGAVREIVGSGTLFADASLLLGPNFHFMEMKLLPETSNVLVMVLPPGGFLVTGLLIIFKRVIDLRSGKEIQMAGAHSV